MGAKTRGLYANPGLCLKDCSHQGCSDVCDGCIRFSNFNSINPEKIEKKILGKKMGNGKLAFHPHYNNAFGKYIGTKGEYLSEMKKGGYEPYTGEAPKPKRVTPDTKPTHAILRAIRDCSNSDGSFTPGSRLKSELMKRGVIMRQSDIAAYRSKVEQFTR